MNDFSLRADQDKAAGIVSRLDVNVNAFLAVLLSPTLHESRLVGHDPPLDILDLSLGQFASFPYRLDGCDRSLDFSAQTLLPVNVLLVFAERPHALADRINAIRIRVRLRPGGLQRLAERRHVSFGGGLIFQALL